MKRKIIIRGNNKSFLSVSLLDILEQIEEISALNWKILYLEAMGMIENESVLELEERINTSKNGYDIPLKELRSLAESLDQIIELILIGDTDIKKTKRYDNDDEMRYYCEICIELIDSSFWEVSCGNNQTIQNILKEIEGVTIENLPGAS